MCFCKMTNSFRITAHRAGKDSEVRAVVLEGLRSHNQLMRADWNNERQIKRCYCIHVELIVHFNGRITSSLSHFFLENDTNTVFECSKLVFAFQRATG